MSLGRCWSQRSCPASGSTGTSVVRLPGRLHRRTRTGLGSTPMPTSGLAKPSGRLSRLPIGRQGLRPRLPAPRCWRRSSVPASTNGYSGTAPIGAVAGRRSVDEAGSAGDRFATHPVIPPLDVSDRWRGEVHRAAQGARVAVAFEKSAAGGRGLLLVVVDPHHEIRIARLDRRVDQIAGEHSLVAAAPGADREVVGCVTGG